MAIKKNDRVMWHNGDEVKHGTVIRAGKKLHVIMDGGEYEVKGDPRIFGPSIKPLPKDPPSPMDDYSVTEYKEHKELSDETTAYTATICYQGIPVLYAKNGGYGGDTEIHPIAMMPIPKTGDMSASETLGRFWEAAKAWTVQFGQTSPYEAYEDWIYWYVNKRPYAVSAQEYNESVERQMHPVTQ